jgi:acylglycerol lipase
VTNNAPVAHLPALFASLILSGSAFADAGAGRETMSAWSDPERVPEMAVEAGSPLPVRRWRPEGEPVAVALALHGFLDHAGSLAVLATALRAEGIALYAYDQQGFGAREPLGRWAGREAMVEDAVRMTAWLRARYPDTPLHLVGKSMGAAVAILALAGREPLPVDGAVLIAPAVWAPETQPWYQRLALGVGRRLAPEASLSVEWSRRLGIRPTDDPAVLEALRADPLVQRRARLDTLHGLTALMGDALEAVPRLPGPTLILYGLRDQVVPRRPLCRLVDALPERTGSPWRLVLYPHGFHMLTRYRRGPATHADVAAWIRDSRGPLPSVWEADRDGARAVLCG